MTNRHLTPPLSIRCFIAERSAVRDPSYFLDLLVVDVLGLSNELSSELRDQVLRKVLLSFCDLTLSLSDGLELSVLEISVRNRGYV